MNPKTEDMNIRALRRAQAMGRARSTKRDARGFDTAFFVALALLTATSAILAKEASSSPSLLRLDSSTPALATLTDVPDRAHAPVEAEPTAEEIEAVRYFNGKPVRHAKTIWMTVTAYSPDHRSCGAFADGQTATLHSIWTNGGKLVAADTSVLPFGSMLTIPGYDSDNVVPVLDRGGAIKGSRLDLLFPTHAEALEWGVKKVPVTVWEYADGSPNDDPRKLR